MTKEGLSRVRFGRIHEVMAAHVERGDVPGLVTLVSRRGEIHVNTIGTKAVGGIEPMTRDTIFRIASMTKPITAVATMILVEEGKLRLGESVDHLLPELADRQVLKRLNTPLDDTVPANRPITVRDLLTLRMGFGYILEPSAEYPIQKAVSEQQLAVGPQPYTASSPDDWMRRLGTIPLMYQPGERWMYDTGFAVLGVLIARAVGQPLETFFRERIFGPLGMNDTSFSVPAAKLDRLAPCYQDSSDTGELEFFDTVRDSQWSKPPAFPDAAGGLVSTIDDYLVFGQMMLNKGTYGNERVLSKSSIETMTTDQLTLEQKLAARDFLENNRGWGFGVSVITPRSDASAVPAGFGWDGGYSTSWYADPKEDLIGILMAQRLVGPQSPRLDVDFWTSVYQAIKD
jgi:CubicO group peptidase (beta-lactamase class C family)